MNALNILGQFSHWVNKVGRNDPSAQRINCCICCICWSCCWEGDWYANCLTGSLLGAGLTRLSGTEAKNWSCFNLSSKSQGTPNNYVSTLIPTSAQVPIRKFWLVHRTRQKISANLLHSIEHSGEIFLSSMPFWFEFRCSNSIWTRLQERNNSKQSFILLEYHLSKKIL